MRKRIGARELKTRLGAYLKQVQQGATIVVTERGEPVAELRPLETEKAGEQARLGRLMALGLVSRISKEPLAPFTPVRSKGNGVSQVIVEEREDRF